MPKANQADRNKTKKKSRRAAAINFGSKRKLSRFGKDQKKGLTGGAVNYITRTRALKKLQITLRDFRRLCILKGIYPRDPKKKARGVNQTYYHIKDIQYLSHEPLLNKFREFKAFMKRMRRAVGRGEYSEAQRMDKSRPKYTVDHLIRERYPSFVDAISDMDDALCLTHLFAVLAKGKSIKVETVTDAHRLVREWQTWVVKSRSLRKVFLSIKGIYFQADVQGIPVTWVVPHQFTHDPPKDVDFRVMSTFSEFYSSFLKFVFFKLYHTLGLTYPPVLAADKESSGALLGAVEVQPLDGAEEAADAAGTEVRRGKKAAAKRVKSLAGAMDSIVAGGGAGEEEEEEGKESDEEEEGSDAGDSDEEEEEEEEIEDDVDALNAGEELTRGADGEEADEALAKAREEQKRIQRHQHLFDGLRFFLSREVPREVFEFVITSFGGVVGWDGAGSSFDATHPGITHVIYDRPAIDKKAITADREYVQPQWVVDSINAHMLLPCSKYAPGVILPPHLSPFVDDLTEGYIPAYRQELDQLRSAAGVLAEGEAALVDEEDESDDDEEEAAEGDSDEVEELDDEEDEDDDDDDEEDEEEEEDVEQYHRASRAEAAKSKPKGGKALKAKEEEERRELAESMMNKRTKMRYSRIMKSVKRKERRVDTLKSKRKAIEQEAAPASATKAKKQKQRK